jgi:hypothetical protein
MAVRGSIYSFSWFYPGSSLDGCIKATMWHSVSKSFRTGHLEQELQMVQLSATRCSCITIVLVTLVSFAAITLCVNSQVFIVVSIYFIINSVQKLLDTSSYTHMHARAHVQTDTDI